MLCEIKILLIVFGRAFREGVKQWVQNSIKYAVQASFVETVCGPTIVTSVI